MYLRTTGIPSHIQLKTCKEAIKFYGRLLLKENLYDKITVNLEFVEFDKKERRKAIAYCSWDDKNVRPKEFTITVHNKLGKRQTLLTLAHEMVHVKQYASNELKDYVKENKVRWKNDLYNSDYEDPCYWDYPWEIEAHGREPGLYVRFKKYFKEKYGNGLRTTK
jgi:hypothetical protein